MNEPKEALNGSGRRNDPALGLVANGSAGSWDVAVDETTAGEQHWFVQVEGPSLDLYFEISSPGIIDQILDFLEQPPSPGGEDLNVCSTRSCSLSLGHFGAAPVRLVRDDEAPARFFVVIGPLEQATARIQLLEGDVGSLATAFRQVREDLQDSGLL